MDCTSQHVQAVIMTVWAPLRCGAAWFVCTHVRSDHANFRVEKIDRGLSSHKACNDLR